MAAATWIAHPTPCDSVAEQIALFTPRLFAFARSLARDDEEAQELVQETCVRALSARERFTPGSNLKAWLFTILRNLMLNRRRARSKRPTVVSLDELAVDTRVSSQHTHDVEREVIVRAELARSLEVLRSLPPAFRLPLQLVAIEGMSYAEVASRLDIALGTVMSRVYRARLLMLERLGQLRD
jgi:RNA polymerase sigma-70 factor (ECF subfamily)